MLRSELFGHKKGSSNQADRDKIGLLEKAAEDCVFLDEIHWMDPQAQGLLLLALQRRGKFRRIGSDEEIPARFRLLVATNQTTSVLRERLMPDFIDRISDLVIELPELRDAREDLPEIWKSVVRRACEELVQSDGTRAASCGVDGMTAEFQPHHVRIERALATMMLPGNFRDLEKLARRLIVAGLARGRFFSLKEDQVRQELDHLRRDERTEAERGSGNGSSLLDELPTVARCEDFLREVRDTGGALSAPAAVEEWERRLLVAAHTVAGSGAKAAALVGMIPRTLNAKIEKWNGASNGGARRSRRSSVGGS
jgi:DNA-binding NtrC family response regulator